jgi:hypothetical protein
MHTLTTLTLLPALKEEQIQAGAATPRRPKNGGPWKLIQLYGLGVWINYSKKSISITSHDATCYYWAAVSLFYNLNQNWLFDVVEVAALLLLLPPLASTTHRGLRMRAGSKLFSSSMHIIFSFEKCCTQIKLQFNSLTFKQDLLSNSDGSCWACNIE